MTHVILFQCPVLAIQPISVREDDGAFYLEVVVRKHGRLKLRASEETGKISQEVTWIGTFWAAKLLLIPSRSANLQKIGKTQDVTAFVVRELFPVRCTAEDHSIFIPNVSGMPRKVLLDL